MSRRLFAALLAANLIVLLWGMREPRAPGKGDPVPDAPPAAPLVLLAERPRPLSGAAASSEAVYKGKRTVNKRAPPAPGVGGGKRRAAPLAAKAVGCCRCAGPFEDSAAAENFAAQLHRLGIDVAVETAPATTVVGYWLMYPAADMVRARRNLRRFRAMGLTDLWLFERGPWRGSISLGLYSEWPRAEAVAERLRSRGIDLAVLPHHRRVTVFWVRMRREPFPGWLTGLASGLGERDCRHLGESVTPIRPESLLPVPEGRSSPRL